jgi:hypothetical protein
MLRSLEMAVGELPPYNRTVTEVAVSGLLISKSRRSEHVETHEPVGDVRGACSFGGAEGRAHSVRIGGCC